MTEIDEIPRKRRSRTTVSIVGMVLLSLLYLAAIFADLIAPYDRSEQTRSEPSAPVSTIRFRDADGNFHIRPFVYRRRLVDARNVVYEEDSTKPYPIALFVHGTQHDLLGLFPINMRLFGVDSDEVDAPRVRLLGTDQLGRDRFSRLLYAMRFSLLVSPIGAVLACLIGVLFGTVSGFSRPSIDAGMMGIADTMISLPTLILILAARAAFPLELPPMRAATLLVGIFALTGWAEIARIARGLVVATRQKEYVLAARSIGLTEPAILLRHILPNIASPLLIQATLILPAFFLAEIALSFLGVGLQEPEASLGNMLSAAGDLTSLKNSPFVVLSPALVVFLFVLAIRLIGWKRDPIRSLK